MTAHRQCDTKSKNYKVVRKCKSNCNSKCNQESKEAGHTRENGTIKMGNGKSDKEKGKRMNRDEKKYFRI